MSLQQSIIAGFEFYE